MLRRLVSSFMAFVHQPRRAIRNLPAMAQGIGGLGGGMMAQTSSYPPHTLAMSEYFLNGALFTHDTDMVAALDTGFTYRGLNVIDEVLAASTRFGTDPGRSPYNAVQAFDPDERLEEIKDRYNKYLEIITAMDPAADLELAQTAAGEFVRNDLLSDADITTAVNSFEDRSSGAFLRSVSRAAAGFFDIRATMGTQFGQTLASMERDHQVELNDFEKTLRLQYDRDRAQAVMTMVEIFYKAQAQQIDGQMKSVGMLQEINKQEIVAKQDQINFDLETEVKDARWDLDLFPYMNQTFASLAGAAASPPGPTKAERQLAMLGTAASILIPIAGMVL